jgi:hypothetical protein
MVLPVSFPVTCMRWIRLASLAVFLTPALGSAAAPDYPARIVSYAEHQGGNIIYHYELRNNGSAEIRRFMIGCDCRWPLDSIPELQLLPVGAIPTKTDDVGTWYELPPEATLQPAGWRARLLRPAGMRGHWVEWYAPGVRGGGAAPGRALGGFRIVVPGTDETYLTSTFTAFPEGTRNSVAAALALLDTTPPTLSLESRSVSTEPGAAAVRVVATTKDDRDPEPRVVVESMGRADTSGGPGYIVVYSATDASGNRTVASTRVPLPAANRTREPAVPPAPAPIRTPVNLPRLAFLP